MSGSQEEIDAVKTGFQRDILNKRVPRKDAIERVKTKFPILANRSLAQIKSRVQYIVKRRETIGNNLLKKSKNE